MEQSDWCRDNATLHEVVSCRTAGVEIVQERFNPPFPWNVILTRNPYLTPDIAARSVCNGIKKCSVLYMRISLVFSHSHGSNDIQQGELRAICCSEAEAVTLSGPVQVVKLTNNSSQKWWGFGPFRFRKSNYEFIMCVLLRCLRCFSSTDLFSEFVCELR